MGELLESPTGEVTWVDDEHAAQKLSLGYKPVSQERAGELTTARDVSGAEGLVGGIGATLTSAASGATLGLSDLVLQGVLTRGQAQDIIDQRKAHPYLSGLGNVAGTVVANPLGELGALGELGEGSSAVERILARTGVGAAEGAGYGAGGYVSDVALGDRDASAEGFLGAMGKGALWGGVAGGALATTGEALANARKLFPRAELAPAEVAKVESEAQQALTGSISDAEAMDTVTLKAVRARRDLIAASNPAIKAEVEAAASKAAREVEASRVPAGLESTEGLGATEELFPLRPKDVPFEAKLADRFAPLSELPGAPQPELPAGFGAKEPIAPKFKIPKSIDEAPTPVAAEVATPATGGPDDLLAQLQGTKKALDQGTPLNKVRPTHIEDSMNAVVGKMDPPIGETLAKQAELRASTDQLKQILSGASDQAPVAGEIDLERLTGAKGFDADLDKVADAVTRHEAASADLAEHLGSDAPPSATLRAKDFRDAQRLQAEKSTSAVTETADKLSSVSPHLEKDLPLGKEVLPPGKSKGAGLREKAGKALQVAELAHHLGLPALSAIPVIGPILSAVAKAKLLKAAYSRLLKGEITQTAETAVASKASETVNRIHAAIDGAFSAVKSPRTATAVVAASVVLSHRLFDDGKPAKKSADLVENFRARSDEVVAAMQPGAIQRAIEDKIKTSDPALKQSLIAAMTSKFNYLYNAMPKPDTADNPLKDGNEHVPSRQAINEWSDCVRVAEDPASVFEKLQTGHLITPTDVHALGEVYPSLLAKGGQALIAKAMTRQKVGFSMRMQLSALTGAPMDRSMSPSMDYLAQTFKIPPPAPPSSRLKGQPNYEDTTSPEVKKI